MDMCGLFEGNIYLHLDIILNSILCVLCGCNFNVLLLMLCLLIVLSNFNSLDSNIELNVNKMICFIWKSLLLLISVSDESHVADLVIPKASQSVK